LLRQHLEDDPSAGDDNQLRLKKLREEREARLEEFRKTGRLTPDQADFVEADEPEKGSAAPSEKNGGRRTRKKLDLILLVGMIAAIVLTYRGPKKSKYTNPNQQVFVKAKDRVRVLQMPVEKD